MQSLLSFFVIFTILTISHGFGHQSICSPTSRNIITKSTRLHMSSVFGNMFPGKNSGLCLHGSQQTRSPLVNWYLEEMKIPFTQKPARPSAHPFGQVPFLTDDGGVEVFESGAILLYLADAYGGNTTPQARASYTKWVVWANSELDGLCFGKGMSGTQLDKPSKALDVLEKILSNQEFLVNNQFSVADVAVASYLNYVPVFFGNVRKLPNRPAIARYMVNCANRPAFAKAFGDDHAKLVSQKVPTWV